MSDKIKTKSTPPDGEVEAAFRFGGFKNLNSTPIPDEFFDLLAVRLSEAELRVLLYIMRRTFGFKKTADAISLSQLTEGIRRRDGSVLDYGTGMSRPAALKAVNNLQAKNIIQIERKVAADGGNEVNVYSLRFQEDNRQDTHPEPKFSNPDYSQSEYSKNKHGSISPDKSLETAELTHPKVQPQVDTINPERQKNKKPGATGVVNQNYPPGKLESLPPPLQPRGGKPALLPPVNNVNQPGNTGLTGVVILDNPQVNSLQPNSLQKSVQQQFVAVGATVLKIQPEQLANPPALSETTADVANWQEPNDPDQVVDEDTDNALYASFKLLMEELMVLGLSQKLAEEYACSYPENYLREKIRLTRLQLARASGNLRNVTGFLRRAIEDNYQPRTSSGNFKRALAESYPVAAEVKLMPDWDTTDEIEVLPASMPNITPWWLTSPAEVLNRLIDDLAVNNFTARLSQDLQQASLTFEGQGASYSAHLQLAAHWQLAGLTQPERTALAMALKRLTGAIIQLTIS